MRCLESVEEDPKKMSVRNCDVMRRIKNSGGQFGKEEGPPRTIMPDEELDSIGHGKKKKFVRICV